MSDEHYFIKKIFEKEWKIGKKNAAQDTCWEKSWQDPAKHNKRVQSCNPSL